VGVHFYVVPIRTSTFTVFQLDSLRELDVRTSNHLCSISNWVMQVHADEAVSLDVPTSIRSSIIDCMTQTSEDDEVIQGS
jgi:hypothetical protein